MLLKLFLQIFQTTTEKHSKYNFFFIKSFKISWIGLAEPLRTVKNLTTYATFKLTS